jgi:hypothetical protein
MIPTTKGIWSMLVPSTRFKFAMMYTRLSPLPSNPERSTKVGVTHLAELESRQKAGDGEADCQRIEQRELSAAHHALIEREELY